MDVPWEHLAGSSSGRGKCQCLLLALKATTSPHPHHRPRWPHSRAEAQATHRSISGQERWARSSPGQSPPAFSAALWGTALPQDLGKHRHLCCVICSRTAPGGASGPLSPGAQLGLSECAWPLGWPPDPFLVTIYGMHWPEPRVGPTVTASGKHCVPEGQRSPKSLPLEQEWRY